MRGNFFFSYSLSLSLPLSFFFDPLITWNPRWKRDGQMRRISLFSAVATIYQMLEILPRLGGGILLGLLGPRSHPHPKDYLLPFRYGMLGILPGSLMIHFSKSVHSEVSPTPAHLGCFVWQSEDSSWIDDDDIVFLEFRILNFCILHFERIWRFQRNRTTGKGMFLSVCIYWLNP